MHRFVSRCLLLVLGLLVGLGWFPQRAHALSLAPSIVEARANPGETANFSITVKNDEQSPLSVYPALQKFLPRGTEGQQQFLPITDQAGLPSWTFVGVNQRVLQPGESTVVPVQVRVPSDAPQGGMYEALFFSGQPPIGERSQVGIRSRIGALILFTVGSATTSELAVSEWRLLEPVTHSLRGSVYIELKNTGRTHITPQGEVVIRGMFGNEVARLPLNPMNARVLPSSERQFTVAFGGSDLTGAQSGVGAELSAFGLGRYTISLEGVTGLSVPPATITFMVWPWYVIGLFVACVLTLIVLLRLYRYRLLKAIHEPRS